MYCLCKCNKPHAKCECSPCPIKDKPGEEEPIVIYTVTFNLNGGSGTISPMAGEEGTLITLPGAPVREQYVFGGWEDRVSGTTYSAGDPYTITADITLYAVWEHIPGVVYHTVTFIANGGSSVSAGEAAHNTAVSPPDDPTRAGHAFAGWYRDAALTSEYNFASPVTGAITLYAKWIPIYTVTFNTNGAGGAAPPAQTAPAGDSITLPAALTRTGYTFGGWNTNSAGTGDTYPAGSPYTVTAAITLYAKWAINIYTVTFDSNSGTPVSSQPIEYGGTVQMPPAPAKDGYYFGGWFTEAALLNRYDFSAPVTADIQLYARWNQTINLPSSVTGNDLQDAINNAAPGDTIVLPPGTDTAVDSVSVDREITISAPPGGNVRLSRPTISDNESPGGFIIEDGGKLILEGGGGTLTLSTTGGNSNSNSLLRVYAGGELLIKEGVVINGPGTTANSTNAIYVDGGKLNMTGGSISGFRRYGAVRINNGGTFDMSGGSISGNAWSAATGGGGVTVTNGTFTMSGAAEISNNSGTMGGGVLVSNGTFNMLGGTIKNNYSLYSNSQTTPGPRPGGGVYVAANGTFNMQNGTISGNYIELLASDPSMSFGGGVYVASGGTFSKTGGTIFGLNAGTPDWNRVGISGQGAAGSGHTVYVENGAKFRDNTAGTGVNLDSRTADGWGE